MINRQRIIINIMINRQKVNYQDNIQCEVY